MWCTKDAPDCSTRALGTILYTLRTSSRDRGGTLPQPARTRIYGRRAMSLNLPTTAETVQMRSFHKRSQPAVGKLVTRARQGTLFT